MEIHLAHPGLAGQGGLGQALALVELAQQFGDALVGKVAAVFPQVGVDVALLHKLLAQVASRLVLHEQSLTLQFLKCWLYLLYNICSFNTICALHSVQILG